MSSAAEVPAPAAVVASVFLGEEKEQTVVSLLKRLPDVRSVGLVHTSEGALAQIKLVATADREPRHLAREVASLLKVWQEVDIPADAIEVAQLLEEEQSRLRFLTYAEKPEGPQLAVSVVLQDRDECLEGKAQGPLVGQALVELAAQATADAVNRYFENPYFCHVEWAQALNAAGHSLVAVVANVHGRTYSGSSVVRGEGVGEAAARAVLNSLNRQIAWPRR